MSPSRMPRDVNARRIAAKLRNILVDPSKCRRRILNLCRMRTARHQPVTRNGDADAELREPVPERRIIGTVARPPGTAVDTPSTGKFFLSFGR